MKQVTERLNYLFNVELLNLAPQGQRCGSIYTVTLYKELNRIPARSISFTLYSALVRILELRVLIVIDCSEITYADRVL